MAGAPVSKAPELPPEMRAALDSFDRAAEKIIASFVRPIEAQPVPEVIYHYTGRAGLNGILESGTVWLTDMFNLNDPSELKHGFGHAVQILQSMSASGPPETKIFTEDMAAFASRGGIPAAAHFFVASLSKAADDLGQWRAYADDARGFALGFTAKPFEDAFTKVGSTTIPNNSTFPVTYDDTQIIGIHRQMIETMFHLISLPRGKNLPSSVINAYMKELSALFAMHALRAAIFFKHEGYVSEREYRFLQIHRADIPPPDVKTRLRKGLPVKFREFNWKTHVSSSLRTIVVGPAADFDASARYAEERLRACGLKGVEIVRSQIPYRVFA